MPVADRLLLFNLRTDVDDHILGFTTRWINELAQHYTQIDVLTTHRGRLAVAENVTVYSTGRERGYGRLRQLMVFYSTLVSLLARHRYAACFAHMQPLFAVLAAPLLTLRGVPLTTWYTHRERHWQIDWAARLSWRVVTAVESSFPISTSKLRPLGHGIDTDFFAPPSVPQPRRQRIVQVARLTEIKHQHILLRAATTLNCEIVFVGDVPDGYADDYKKRLRKLVEELGIEDRVIFAGAQRPDQVRDWYHSACVAVNLSPPGLFDKAALESMACAVPTVVSNEAFSSVTDEYRPLLHIAAPDDIDSLREQLAQLLTLTDEDRRVMGAALARQVQRQHSLSTLIEKLVNVLQTGETA